MNVEIQSFRSQLDWLQCHGQIVSLHEAVKRRAEPGAERLYALTFDDGYSDVYLNAFPLIEERGIPFTLYLTSGPIENPDGFPNWPGEPLTWGHAREMIDSGLVTVGAHTHSHPDMSTLGDEAIRSEISASNTLIEERCGVVPRHFTYPWGRWSFTADAIVRSTYDTATVGSGSGISADADVHRLHRLPIQRSDIRFLFEHKLRSGARIEDRARRLIRQYKGL